MRVQYLHVFLPGPMYCSSIFRNKKFHQNKVGFTERWFHGFFKRKSTKIIQNVEKSVEIGGRLVWSDVFALFEVLGAGQELILSPRRSDSPDFEGSFLIQRLIQRMLIQRIPDFTQADANPEAVFQSHTHFGDLRTLMIYTFFWSDASQIRFL